MLIHEGGFEMSRIKHTVYYDVIETFDGRTVEEAWTQVKEIVYRFGKDFPDLNFTDYKFEVDYDIGYNGETIKNLSLVAFREQTEEELKQIKQAEKYLKKKADAHKLELYNQLKKELGL